GAENSGSNASKRDASISNLVLVPQRSTGKADFRDGLRVASTHLPVVLLPAAHCSWQPDSADQFIGPQVHQFIALVKAMVRDPARAARGNQLEFSIINEQRRRRISGGRGVGNISSQRATVLGGDSAGFRGREAEKRKLTSQHWVLANLCISRKCTERQRVGRLFDAAQLRQSPNADKASLRKLVRFEEHHQIGAAVKGFPGAGFARENIK